ncbi:MAG: CBS domain-containing protein [Proteobacteria bacterium]|nr:CBS domain-containing protein [Pseudomonadota bacterium]
MTRDPIAVSRDTSLEKAATLMVEHRISGLPVVDEAGAVIGMITEGDLIRRAELDTSGQAPGWLSRFLVPGLAAEEYPHSYGVRVREVMTEKVIAIIPDTPLSAIVQSMEAHCVKRLPVVQDGKLIGMVSRTDLLRVLSALLGARKVVELRGAVSDDRELALAPPR